MNSEKKKITRFQKKKKEENRNCKDTRNSRFFPRPCPLPRREIAFETTFSLDERHPTREQRDIVVVVVVVVWPFSFFAASRFTSQRAPSTSEGEKEKGRKRKGGGKYRSRPHRVSEQASKQGGSRRGRRF